MGEMVGVHSEIFMYTTLVLFHWVITPFQNKKREFDGNADTCHLFLLSRHLLQTGDVQDFTIVSERQLVKGISHIVAVTREQAKQVRLDCFCLMLQMCTGSLLLFCSASQQDLQRAPRVLHPPACRNHKHLQLFFTSCLYSAAHKQMHWLAFTPDLTAGMPEPCALASPSPSPNSATQNRASSPHLCYHSLWRRLWLWKQVGSFCMGGE